MLATALVLYCRTALASGNVNVPGRVPMQDAFVQSVEYPGNLEVYINICLHIFERYTCGDLRDLKLDTK